jgi:hypothetical protein
VTKYRYSRDAPPSEGDGVIGEWTHAQLREMDEAFRTRMEWALQQRALRDEDDDDGGGG